MAKRIREKTEKINKTKDTRPYATAKFLRISNTKLDIIMDLVRGKKYFDAVAILANTPNKAAELILNVVESAGANAENNKGLNKQDLYVAEIYSGQGTSYKRQNIRGRGRVDLILKRTSHITVKLDTVK
ncbi:MAG: 50S ribosomal protein L22 [Clostridia bacterium]|nr:50S ribosomal protein L22 [Clostridia bacterium]